MLILTVWISFMAVYYQAGQPLSRSVEEMVQGRRIKLTYAGGRLEYVNLWIEEKDIDLYNRIIAVIKQHSQPGETICAIPFHGEMFFLSDRKNVFPFVLFSHGVADENELETAIKKFRETPARLIINDLDDKRQTALTRKFMAEMKKNYVLLSQIDNFEIYTHRD